MMFELMLPFFQRILFLIVGFSAAHTSLCCCTICEQGSHARKPVFWDLKKNQTRKQWQDLEWEQCRWMEIVHLHELHIFTWQHTFPDRDEHHHKSPWSHTAPSYTSGSSSCLRTSQKTSDTPEISDTKGLNHKLWVIFIRCYQSLMPINDVGRICHDLLCEIHENRRVEPNQRPQKTSLKKNNKNAVL